MNLIHYIEKLLPSFLMIVFCLITRRHDILYRLYDLEPGSRENHLAMIAVLCTT
jgi:hypothetical protein